MSAHSTRARVTMGNTLYSPLDKHRCTGFGDAACSSESGDTHPDLGKADQPCIYLFPPHLQGSGACSMRACCRRTFCSCGSSRCWRGADGALETVWS